MDIFQPEADAENAPETVIVWGLGYIGLSGLVCLLNSGFDAYGYDHSESHVARLRGGLVALPGIDEQFEDGVASVLCANATRLSHRLSDLPAGGASVHMLCIPTERNEQPDFTFLTAAIAELTTYMVHAGPRGRPVLIVCESTVSPGIVRSEIVAPLEAGGFVHGRDFSVVVSPRRDCFGAERFDLTAAVRIVGISHEPSRARVRRLLSTHSPQLAFTKSIEVAELVKAVENCFRYVSISFANELATMFPELDVIDVLDAASTKWNIERYFPGLGIGGYCIPLAPRYLQHDAGEGAPPRSLIINACFEVEAQVQSDVVAWVRRETGNPPEGRVLALGLSYKGDVRGFSCSPVKACAEQLAALGWRAGAFEPMQSMGLAPAFAGQLLPDERLQDELAECDAILVGYAHPLWSLAAVQSALERRNRPLLIADHEGALESLANHPRVRYLRRGRPTSTPSEPLEGVRSDATAQRALT